MSVTLTKTPTATRIAYIRIVDAFPESGKRGKVVEVHAIPYDKGYWKMRKRVREILGQWMSDTDRMENLETSTWKTGESCAPYIIRTAYGEPSDIFAQLIF